MADRKLPCGEDTSKRQLVEIIKEIGPSCTSNREKFNDLLLEWADCSDNFSFEIAISFIHMLNDTSNRSKKLRSNEKNPNYEFTEVLRARWNVISDNRDDQNLFIQIPKEGIGSAWNPSIFVEGINKIIKIKNLNYQVEWENIISDIIDNSHLLDLKDNDGSFELFCSLLGESYGRDENKRYSPGCNELYFKIDPFIKKWKKPEIQALFLIKICGMSREISNNYNLQQKDDSKNKLEDRSVNDSKSYDPIYTDMYSYSIVLDASGLIPSSLISMFEEDTSLSELVQEGVLGTPCDYLSESKLPKIGIFHSRGSCGIFLCKYILRTIVEIRTEITNQEILDQIERLLFYEIPKYSPIGLLSSLGAFYDDFPYVTSLSTELVDKINESFDVSIINNEITKLTLIKMAIASSQEFILFPRPSMVSTSYEKEYGIGSKFGITLQIIFSSLEPLNNGNRHTQFIRDFISLIAFSYRISSMAFISKLNLTAHNFLWDFLNSESKTLPHFHEMDLSNNPCEIVLRGSDAVRKDKDLNYSIDYFHWWFLCIDLIFSGISISQNPEFGSPCTESDKISDFATDVLTSLFKEELSEGVESLLFVIAIMDYLRARLVFMTYASPNLQTILVNRRTSFPSFSVDKAANFKVIAARIVRRNLSLGDSQLYCPSEFWNSSSETPSFAFSCWFISSSSVVAIQDAILEFGDSIRGYENAPISELINALLEFEKVRTNISHTGSDSIDSNIKETNSDVLIGISGNCTFVKDESDEKLSQFDLNKTDNFTGENRESIHDCANKNIEISKVNDYLSKCYTGEMSTIDLITELRDLHLNAVKSNGDCKIFNVFLQTLFDECRSYPKYPLPELKITAEVLGMLVKEDLLISYGNALVFVLRCIIEALKKGHWTKMFCFGIFAMEQFIDRFISFPQFLSAIVNMSQHLKPVIEEYVNYCESCVAIIPEHLKNKLFIEKCTIDSLRITPPSVPETLISKVHPEMIAFENKLKECHLNSSTHTQRKDQIEDAKVLDLSGKKTLPSGVSIDQLQGFGLGALEKLMNDPEILEISAEPPENVIEHIFTICNALASTNIDSKATEMAEILKDNPEYCNWFALYLVKNRASKEKNNHSTYINFLVKLNKLIPIKNLNSNESEGQDKPLIHKGDDEETKVNILSITTIASYGCIKALLQYSSILNEVSSFVNVLRHLGLWLGQITIGIDRPIVHKYLNPRKLLIDSYSKGCIASVLPFVCKILESAKYGYYRSPNPWTNSILFTLAEIHSLSNNTNSHMFEVELLFKQLELNLEDYVDKTNYLGLNTHMADCDQLKTVDDKQSNNPPSKIQNDFNSCTSFSGSFDRSNNGINTSLVSSSNLYYPNSNVYDAQFASTFIPPGQMNQVVFQQSQHPISPSEIQFWANRVLISPSIALFQAQPSLRGLIPLALDRSIKEILHLVIPRSVRIAALTTREIIGKEFAFEPDENVYKRAAHLMVAALSGSMATTACREPLRVAFSAQLRQVLHSASLRDGEDNAIIEQVVQIVCGDNIDLGCQIIEQAVVEKAIIELDEIISPGIVARRKSRESGHQFVDNAYYGGPNTQNAAAYWSSLPDILKYRQNSMRHLQLYRDFLQFNTLRNMERRDANSQYDMHSIQQNQTTQPPYQNGSSDPFFGQNSQTQHWNGSLSNHFSVHETTQNLSVKSDSNSQLSNPNQVHNSTLIGLPTVQPPEPVRVPLVFEMAYLPLMMRIDECLAQIKDVIREIALYPPISSKRIIAPISNSNFESHCTTQTNLFSNPLGSTKTSVPPKSTAHPVLSVLASLHSDHTLFYLSKVFFTIGKSASHREDVLVGISQKLFKTLFDAGAAFQQSTTGVLQSARCIASSLGFDAALLHIEVFLGLCKQISSFSSKFWLKLRKEAIGWFIYTIEDPKYSVDIIIGSLRYDLISSSELDLPLSNILETAISSLNDTNSVPTSNNKHIRNIEFICKLFFRSIEDWHFPINKKLPNTTQVLSRSLSSSFIQNNNLSSITIILPGLYYKPYPHTTNLGDLISKLNGLLTELDSNKSIVFHDQWIGEDNPEILNFHMIFENSTDAALNPDSIALPVPVTPSADIVKGINVIFDEWILLLRITIFSGVGGLERNNPYRNLFLQRLSRQGLLRMDDTTEKLFTVCIDRAVNLSLNRKCSGAAKNSSDLESLSQNQYMDPFPIDSLVRLITTMARYVDPQQMAAVVITHKFLSVLTRIIYRDAESSKFNQRPYYRIFYSLLQEYESIGFNTEMIHFTCLLSIVNHLQYLNPNRVPGFTYSWIQIVSSNRLFPYLLRHAKGWQPYHALLIQLFTFISPFLRSVKLSSNIKAIYGALLRILLVLLHDFPEFLCDYSCSFCDVLPVNCVQIRNLILSAFPRNMKLPDPFLPTLKIENLPEMKIIPRMIANYGMYILHNGLKANIDKFWVTRDSSILPVISEILKLPREEALRSGTKYSPPLITGLLLYIGIYLQNGNGPNANFENSQSGILSELGSDTPNSSAESAVRLFCGYFQKAMTR
ncbi:transcription regulatory protein [Cryptosporidium felis]|nr:transcription regulatory protein [Cryptosporidium felis]